MYNKELFLPQSMIISVSLLVILRNIIFTLIMIILHTIKMISFTNIYFILVYWSFLVFFLTVICLVF